MCLQADLWERLFDSLATTLGAEKSIEFLLFPLGRRLRPKVVFPHAAFLLLYVFVTTD